MSKEYISIKIKEQVWKRDCHVSDIRIAQCKTCYCLIKIPQSLKHLIASDDLIPYECNGVGEFGHIIAEKNGGKVEIDNLIIQCKKCNVSLGTKKAIIDNFYQDQYMIPVELLDDPLGNTKMPIDCNFCSFILKNQLQCKNKPLNNYSYCHIHLK